MMTMTTTMTSPTTTQVTKTIQMAYLTFFLLMMSVHVVFSSPGWQSQRIHPLPPSYNSILRKSSSSSSTSSTSSSPSITSTPSTSFSSSSSSPTTTTVTSPPSTTLDPVGDHFIPSLFRSFRPEMFPLEPNIRRFGTIESAGSDHEAVGSSSSDQHLMSMTMASLAAVEEGNSRMETIVNSDNNSGSSSEASTSSDPDDSYDRMINEPVTLVPVDEEAAEAEVLGYDDEGDRHSTSEKTLSSSDVEPETASSQASTATSPTPMLETSERPLLPTLKKRKNKPIIRYLSAPLSDGRTSILIPLPKDLDEKTGVVFVEDIRENDATGRRTFRTHIFRPSKTEPISITLKPASTSGSRGSRGRGARHSTIANTINDINQLLSVTSPNLPSSSQTIKMISVSDKFMTTQPFTTSTTPPPRSSSTSKRSEPSTTFLPINPTNKWTTAVTTTTEQPTTLKPTTTTSTTTTKTQSDIEETTTQNPTTLLAEALVRASQASSRRIPSRRLVRVEQPPIPTAPPRLTSTTEATDTTTFDDETTTTIRTNIGSRLQTILRVIPVAEFGVRSSRPTSTESPTTTTIQTTTTTTTTPAPTTLPTTTEEPTTTRPPTTTSTPVTSVRIMTRHPSNRIASESMVRNSPPSRLTVLRVEDVEGPSSASRTTLPFVFITSTNDDFSTTTSTPAPTTIPSKPSSTTRKSSKNFRSNTTTSEAPTLSEDEDTIHYPVTVPGVPGVDYPLYSEVPLTNFDCRNTDYPGFYADLETGCQVYHSCGDRGRRHSFLCPNGTIFSQEYLICDWWYNVRCSDSPNHFQLNREAFSPSSTTKVTSTTTESPSTTTSSSTSTTPLIPRLLGTGPSSSSSSSSRQSSSLSDGQLRPHIETIFSSTSGEETVETDVGEGAYLEVGPYIFRATRGATSDHWSTGKNDQGIL